MLSCEVCLSLPSPQPLSHRERGLSAEMQTRPRDATAQSFAWMVMSAYLKPSRSSTVRLKTGLSAVLSESTA